MKNGVVFLTLLCCFSVLFGQNVERKSIPAQRLNDQIKVDGKLEEEAWAKAPVAKDFVSFEPENGLPIGQDFRTEVRVLYDDEAIYIGAVMYDPNPDSILRQLTERDVYNENTDWFGFFINPYNDGLSDFNFWVTAAGTQADSRTTPSQDDFSLNSVWLSKVSITDEGWVMEAKVPYLALRFPETLSKDWGLNFMRSVRRTRKTSTWNFLDLSSGYRLEYQCGLLKGVSEIEPPIRLSAMPYISGYINDFDGVTTQELNAGLDLKYGLNESFTLDMTVIPDFGQVAYDPQFLNLSPFENQFDENRQFFTEGTELFNIGELLYTRRIGGEPKNIQGVDLNSTDSVEIVQEFTRMLNATKISGRTKGNLGIGVLNAITDDNFSTRTIDGESTEVLTEPMTNYNVLVLDQRFNRNSSISLVNTNVLRKASAQDANVTALLGSFYDKRGAHLFNVGGYTSNIFYRDNVETGYRADLSLGKTNGNWRWLITEQLQTENYNINDLGFQQRNNLVQHYGEIRYLTTQPTKRFNRFSHTLSATHQSLFRPFRFESFNLNYNTFYLFRSFFAFGGDVNISPVNSYDYFEPRAFGRWFKKPRELFLNGFISSDYRKVFALDVRGNIRLWDELGRTVWQLRAAPRLRLGDHFFTVVSFRVNRALNDFGFVPDSDPDNIFFGRRNNLTVENSIDARYVFNPNTSLSLAVRHTYTDVDYNEFYLLEMDGSLTKSDLTGVQDLNFNAFNVDLRFSWWFAPASELVFLYRNSIATIGNIVGNDYFTNIEGVFTAPMQNNVSLRLSYFLDYHTSKQQLKNRFSKEDNR